MELKKIQKEWICQTYSSLDELLENTTPNFLLFLHLRGIPAGKEYIYKNQFAPGRLYVEKFGGIYGNKTIP